MSALTDPRVLYLDDALAARVLQAAACAYPNECCGLIEGIDLADGWRATGIHEATNIAEDKARRFLIDPKVQFDLMRRLRGSDTRLIGCFHSHPGGGPEPSVADRAEAYESDFLYLIAGGSADLFTLKAHVFNDAAGFSPIEIA
jgi:proteasome lid subunit RPN8/RPN11